MRLEPVINALEISLRQGWSLRHGIHCAVLSRVVPSGQLHSYGTSGPRL